MRIRWRLPLAFVLTTLVFAGIVALASALLLRGVFLDRLQDDMARQARQYAAVLESTGEPDGPGNGLQSLTQSAGAAGEVRFTVIAHDGRVLADSEADPATLDNHAGRPEVAQALAGHEGRARRRSATLGQQEVYVAIPLPAGEQPWSSGVLRAALPAARIDAMLSASWRIPLIVWAVLLLPTLAAAYLISRSITRPLERIGQMTKRVAAGDFSYRTAVRRDDELGELAGELNSMTEQLETRATELTQELERSDRVLGAMSEGVLLIDAAGRLLRSNPAAAQILGVALEGQEGTPVVHVARSFPGLALAQRAREAGAPITEILDLPAGRSLTVEVIPLRSARPEENQTLFVIRDETERRRTERMRRDFVSNVSHELKTPLAGLSLLADTLTVAVREDPEQAEQFIDRLGAETRRLTNLTNDLLTLSHLEEPQPPVKPPEARVDLARLARETAIEMEPRAAAKQQELAVDAPEEIILMGDKTGLQTLIRNLLDNAIRYTDPRGHIALRVYTREDTKGGRSAVLTVQDDGAGIPAADQDRIFERFYRVDKARSRETGGTGLGLSIVKHVAESHGGKVKVESTLGVGSTFTVSLPC
jgi:two-component system phosphate regulon sensor histidine kinase PhoR